MIIIVLVILLVAGFLFFTQYRKQSLTVRLDLNNVYRYTPKLNTKRYSVDTIEVKVSAPLINGIVVNAGDLADIVTDQILDKYSNATLSNASDIMKTKINRRGVKLIKRDATVENLSLLFFNTLDKYTKRIGCKLVSVTVYSEGLSATHYRSLLMLK